MAKTATKSTRRVYTPHKAGLPHLGEYVSELWRRRDFAKELSDTNIRAGNTNTFLGQAWLVLNPLLLAGVYFLLVVVLTGGRNGAQFPQIAGGLFLFFFVTGIVQACATSVTNAGSLVLNMNFPKQLLILSNTYLAFRRFLPTMAVYLVIHLAFRKEITWALLWTPLVWLFAMLIGQGLGSLVATWNVYFRDTAQFLPYFIRIWLYASPVLYTAEQFMATGIGERAGNWILLNPMFGVLGMWGDILGGNQPQLQYILASAAWAIFLTVVGTLYFVSRERDFPVRL